MHKKIILFVGNVVYGIDFQAVTFHHILSQNLKTLPVTAVTPLQVPPLPSSQTVPSRFFNAEDDPYSYSKKHPGTQEVSYERSYSLWYVLLLSVGSISYTSYYVMAQAVH